MALKDAIQTQTQTLPPFETDEEVDTMTAEAHAVSAPAPEVAQASVPAVAQTTAVGAARAPAKFPPIYADKQDAFDIETVVGLSMAVERIKAEQGACYIGNDNLGARCRVEIISWNYRWILSPGLQSKDPGYEESKQFLANTYDNQTVYGKDVTVEEYLQDLKETHAYDKANKSMYIDLFGMLTWTEKKGDIPEEERKMVVVQLSQTSAGQFAAFCQTQGVLVAKGVVKNVSDVVEIEAVARTKGTNKYTNFSFHAAK